MKLVCALSLAAAATAQAEPEQHDPPIRQLCARVASLNPESFAKVMLPMPARSGEKMRLDVDNDGKAEVVSWDEDRRSRYWNITRVDGSAYLRPFDPAAKPSSEQEKRRGWAEEDASMESGDSVWIKIDGVTLSMGLGDERRLYPVMLWRIRDGKYESLCNFDSTETADWVPSSPADEEVCRATNNGKATELKLEVTERSKKLRLDLFALWGEQEGKRDIDADSRPDALVRWKSFSSLNGKECEYHWLDVDPAHPNPSLRKSLLSAQGMGKLVADVDAVEYIPRDEFGYSRCYESNTLLKIKDKVLVRADARLSEITAAGARTVCKGKRNIKWRVHEYLR